MGDLPNYARMTMFSAGHDYWFLYEGTPGGELDSSDFITFSDGTNVAWNGVYNKDIPNEEWAYASDPNVGANGRSLFLINHEDDTGKDSYRDQDDRMTILAFGRNADDGTKYLDANAMPRHFTIGLMDATNFTQASKIVRGAYKALSVAPKAPELYSATSNPDPTNPNLTVSMISNRTITATFVPNFYAIDLAVVNTMGDPIEPALVQVDAPADPQGYVTGEQVTLTADQSSGWTFQGWSGSIGGSDPTATVTVDGNESITATFSLNHYAVTTSAIDEEGQPAPNSSVQLSAPADSAGYLYGEAVTATAIAAPGWTFQGWSGAASGSGTTVTFTVNANEAIIATFAQNHYTVVASAVDGTGAAAPGSTVQLSPAAAAAGYVYGEMVTATALAAPGWSFQGWSGSATGSAQTVTFTVDANEALTATFRRNFYTVTAVAVNGQGAPAGDSEVQISAPTNSQGYTFGEQVSLTAVAAPGWVFQGWSGSASGTSATTTITVDGNEQVTATFAQQHYTISVTLIDESGQTVNAAAVNLSSPADPAGYIYGEAVTVLLTPLDNWTFGSWEGDISSDENPLSFTVTGNTKLQARFANTNKARLTVQRMPTAGGTVTPATGTFFTIGEAVVVTAIPTPGWRFVEWGGALSGNTNPATLIMSGNQRVEAHSSRCTTHSTLPWAGSAAQMVALPNSHHRSAVQAISMVKPLP
ncbi:MAG: InlB B-repeat-containing protein [Caldilineaceae bacterium]